MAFYAASTVLGKRDEKSKTDNKQKKKKKKKKNPMLPVFTRWLFWCLSKQGRIGNIESSVSQKRILSV